MANLHAQSALFDRQQKAMTAHWTNGVLTLEEMPCLGLVKLQRAVKGAAFHSAVTAAKLVLPSPGWTSGNDHGRCLWLTPHEWLWVMPAGREGEWIDRLTPLFNDVALLTDISDSRVVIALSGKHVQDLLAKASAVDWHVDRFAIGQCAVTRFAQVAVLVHRISEQGYELLVDRAYGVYLWDWLVDAAGEFKESTIIYALNSQ
ncbi:sarcosine oxidase subunit gamma [Oceanicoccus sagamiensis]|uniref:Sarcosine oxidase subunit gamma n=1 Tax=Oceanicoccus sagamiensis TaxID=716816 RepID=A0A1X9NIM1_9GAMM|nr:sarcosine oxidase subunit gamma family protein [Oceanicoccus sagamiensis]ARN73833.1 hypothetical protein BST96_06720 [Oceanicoccus sagamiensis]